MTAKLRSSVFGLIIVGAAGAAPLPAQSAQHVVPSQGRAGAEVEQSGMMEGQMMGSQPSVGLLMPMMNPARGRELFASKGCVVCHSVNGVGGEDARPLDASTMDMPMNPFEFAARMWRGAEAMIYLQQEELGEQIEFTGAELEIEDVVLDPTDRSIAYVLVSRGGFLGMGEELVAVRWQDLRATADHEIFVLDVLKPAFEQAPVVGSGNFAQTASQSWRQQMDRFWDDQLKG